MPAFLHINFNRPQKTAETLKPLLNKKTLYIFCDGPKTNSKEKTTEVQNIILQTKKERENQGLTTHILLQEKNLGPKNGPLTAIQWFFSQENQGHIIEDDILVCPQFEEFHSEALLLIENLPNVFCVAEGHPLPNCQHKWIITKMARLTAWSSSKEKILPLLNNTNTKPTLWKNHGIKLTKNLHPKTQIFLWKEFLRMEKNPNWSWHYDLMQTQLHLQLQGLTPTTRLHSNLGIDGSGNNCLNLFNETENFNPKEILAWKNKKNTPKTDKKHETLMEIQRYGRIHQSIARKLFKITPRPLKKFWKPTEKS